MIPSVGLLADGLVAILLVATIVSSLRLSRRIAGLKADEGALRSTVAELIAATATAERAIAGLRAAVGESERLLVDRLGEAEQAAARLADQLGSARTMFGRLAKIAGSPRHPRPSPEPDEAPTSGAGPWPPSEPTDAPAAEETLRAAVAAARASAVWAGRRDRDEAA